MVPLRAQLPKGAQRATSSQIHQLAQELSKCTSITVVSGAGISTECGLSDYRSPGKLYPPRPPIKHQQYVTSPLIQKLYWARSFIGYPLLSTAKPGLSHYSLSSIHDDLGHQFRKHITQNVDGLILKSTKDIHHDKIVELHGSIHWLKCASCAYVENRKVFQNRLIESNQQWAKLLGQYDYRPDGDADITGELIEKFTLPNCYSCNTPNMIMPTVVFHGGSVPKTQSEQATKSVNASDAIFVVGSSMSTYSAFRLVKIAKEQGKKALCINFGPTRADDLWDLKIEALVGDALARLADLLIVGGFHPPEDMTGFFQSEKESHSGMLQL